MKMPGLLDDKELQAKYDQFRVNPIAMNPLQMAMYQAGEGIATGQGARLDQVLRGAAQGGVQGYNQALQNQQVYARAKAQMDAQRAQLERKLAKEEQEKRKRELEIEEKRQSIGQKDTTFGQANTLFQRGTTEYNQKQADLAEQDLSLQQRAKMVLEAQNLPATERDIKNYLLVKGGQLDKDFAYLVPDVPTTAANLEKTVEDAKSVKFIKAMQEGDRNAILANAPDSVLATTANNMLKTKEDIEAAKTLYERTVNVLDTVFQKDAAGNFVMDASGKATKESVFNSPEYFSAYATFTNQFAKPILGEGGKLIIPQIAYPAPDGLQNVVNDASNRTTVKVVNQLKIVTDLSKPSKEAVTGAVKGISFADEVLQSLQTLNDSGKGLPSFLEQAFLGTQEASDLAVKYANLVLTIKETPYNLGVLQGIDNVVLQRVISDPTPSNMINFAQRFIADDSARMAMAQKALESQKRFQIKSLNATLLGQGLKQDQIDRLIDDVMNSTNMMRGALEDVSQPVSKTISPFADNPGTIDFSAGDDL